MMLSSRPSQVVATPLGQRRISVAATRIVARRASPESSSDDAGSTEEVVLPPSTPVADAAGAKPGPIVAAISALAGIGLFVASKAGAPVRLRYLWGEPLLLFSSSRPHDLTIS